MPTINPLLAHLGDRRQIIKHFKLFSQEFYLGGQFDQCALFLKNIEIGQRRRTGQRIARIGMPMKESFLLFVIKKKPS
jgi:hypothetical protein